jgi:hypothetical protein
MKFKIYAGKASQGKILKWVKSLVPNYKIVLKSDSRILFKLSRKETRPRRPSIQFENSNLQKLSLAR